MAGVVFENKLEQRTAAAKAFGAGHGDAASCQGGFLCGEFPDRPDITPILVSSGSQEYKVAEGLAFDTSQLLTAFRVDAFQVNNRRIQRIIWRHLLGHDVFIDKVVDWPKANILTLCPARLSRHAPAVAHESDTVERLWQDYAGLFRGFDDLTLARWMAQTLSQLQGKLWRMSHPLVASYRLAAMVGHDRQIWHQRLVNPPVDFPAAECCRAPLLPMVTRDVLENGLICLHCNGTALPLEELADGSLRERLSKWAEDYSSIHGVAHWDEIRQNKHPNYEQAFESAAQQSERLLAYQGVELAPALMEFFPAVIWEDQDECLQVRPEDIIT